MYQNKKIQKIRQVWLKAKKHKKASHLGLPSDMSRYQLCQCCDQPIQKQPISMWQHTRQFQVFGFGYPLWFSFLKYSIALILVLITTNTANQIYIASQQNKSFCYPQNQTVSSVLINRNLNKKQFYNHQNQFYQIHLHLRHVESNQLSEGNQFDQHDGKYKHDTQHAGQDKKQCTSFMVFFSKLKEQKMQDSAFISIVQFLVHLIALISIRSIILKQLQYYNQRRNMISDYSLIISNLPQKFGIKTMLTNLFQRQFKKYPNFNIKQMIYIFKSQPLEQIKQMIQSTRQKVIQKLDQQKFEQVNKLQEQIKMLQTKLEYLSDEILTDITQDRIKCDKMIVVMNKEEDKGEIMHEYQENKGRDYRKYFREKLDEDYLVVEQNVMKYNNTTKTRQSQKLKQQFNIKIQQAPQPNQIIWQNINIPNHERRRLLLQGWLLTFLFLTILTVLFYFLLKQKTKLFMQAKQLQHKSQNHQTALKYRIIGTFIVFSSMLGVVLFNKLILVQIIQYFVKIQKHTHSDQQNFSFALKYAIGMFFTTAIMTLSVEAITYNNFYSHNYGLIQEQTIMFFVTAFLIPLIWIIHPFYQIKKCKLKSNVNKLVDQKVANQLVESISYNLGKRYAQVFEIMWFTFLYSKLIPLGSFLVLIGLVIYYWVDKYNFLRRSTLKSGISGKMAILGLKALDVTLFLTNAGQLLFDFLIRNKFNYLSFILMLLGIAYLFIPISQLIWYFNHQKFRLQQTQYDQAKNTFKYTYSNMHPVYSTTHKQQIQQHRQVVNEYHLRQLKKIKMYGVGRGYYMKDTPQQRKYLLMSENRISSKYII